MPSCNSHDGGRCGLHVHIGFNTASGNAQLQRCVFYHIIIYLKSFNTASGNAQLQHEKLQKSAEELGDKVSIPQAVMPCCNRSSTNSCIISFHSSGCFNTASGNALLQPVRKRCPFLTGLWCFNTASGNALLQRGYVDNHDGKFHKLVSIPQAVMPCCNLGKMEKQYSFQGRSRREFQYRKR